MTICQNCVKEFDDEPEPAVTPAEVLGELFLGSVGSVNPGAQDVRQLCPTCREKLGIVNFLSFRL
jgi:hypothetical protein